MDVGGNYLCCESLTVEFYPPPTFLAVRVLAWPRFQNSLANEQLWNVVEFRPFLHRFFDQNIESGFF